MRQPFGIRDFGVVFEAGQRIAADDRVVGKSPEQLLIKTARLSVFSSIAGKVGQVDRGTQIVRREGLCAFS